MNTRAPVSQDAAQLVERLRSLRDYRRMVFDVDGQTTEGDSVDVALTEAADLIEALTRVQPSTGLDMGAQSGLIPSAEYERRILALEVELEKVIEAAGRLASIMRRNCVNIDDAIIVAEGWNKRQAWVRRRDDNPPPAYSIEGFMPAVIEVEKAIAEATGLDSDDNWVRKVISEHEAETHQGDSTK